MFVNCLVIFFIRVVETMLNTFRTIFIIRNNKKLAVIIAFFEITVWLTAIRKIISDDFGVYQSISYALGFALGTYIGMLITDNLSSGNLRYEFISNEITDNLLNYLDNNDCDFMVTEIIENNKSKKALITVFFKNKKIKKKVTKELKSLNNIKILN